MTFCRGISCRDTRRRNGYFTTRVAVVGLGQHMQANLLPVLQLAEKVRVVAVCCTNEERAGAIARRYGVEASSGRWLKLLSSSSIDAVVVAGPPSLHFEVLSYALERGLHVFVEKPPAEDPQQLRELVGREAMLDSRKCKIFVDYNFRYGSAYCLMREVLAAYGEIAYAKIRFVTAKPRVSMWNCGTVLRSYLYAVAIHPVEMTIDLFGQAGRITTGFQVFSGGRLAVHVGIDFVAGGRADLELGNYVNKLDFGCELVTSTGTVGLLDDQRRIRLIGEDMREVRDGGLGAKAHLEYWCPSSQGGYETAGYANALRSFCRSIATDAPSESPLARSVPVLDLLEHVAQAGERLRDGVRDT
jgi:phthalate 4,5-cis-dihydrodiol dehydrogenase